MYGTWLAPSGLLPTVRSPMLPWLAVGHDQRRPYAERTFQREPHARLRRGPRDGQGLVRAS